MRRSNQQKDRSATFSLVAWLITVLGLIVIFMLSRNYRGGAVLTRNRDSLWQIAAHIATIVASLIAALALIFSALSFREASQTADRAANDQANSLAIGILQRQMELDFEHPEYDERSSDEILDPTNPTDEEYLHFAEYTVTAAESIYNLVGGNESWDQTVNGLIQSHLPFVFSPEFPCNQYSQEFVDFVQSITQADADRLNLTVCGEM